VILIHPPVAKPSEPPAGIARLSGMLSMHRVDHCLLDANIEGLHYLLRMHPPPEKGDRWTRRALKNIERNIASLQAPDLYRHPDRYRRAVKDVARVLAELSPSGTMIGLSDYEQDGLSPVKSSDLLSAAEYPEMNPFYPYFSSKLRELFMGKKPAHVGISLNYLSQALCTFAITGFIRREFTGVKIVLGGGLITSWMKNGDVGHLFAGLIDHLVAGPGEDQLLSLLGLEKQRGPAPRPDYGEVSKHRYLSPGFILPYAASAGCYWNRCDFCPENAEGNPYSAVPVRQVVADLTDLSEKTRPSLVHLLDNAVSPALLTILCAENVGVPWYGFARISPLLSDLDFCRDLKKAGCVMLKLGIESGDQDVLDRLGKGIEVRQASTVLKNLKKAGITAYVYLLFGTPPETVASARKTLDFTIRHSDCIDFLNLAIFNMPVCSKGTLARAAKRFYEGDLSLYADFDHPYGWDRKNVRLFLDREFKRHPAVSAVLRHEIPVFTSNHAPFFVMGRKEQRAR